MWLTTSSTTSDPNGYIYRFGVFNDTVSKCMAAVLPSPNATAVRGLGTPALCGSVAVVGVQSRM